MPAMSDDGEQLMGRAGAIPPRIVGVGRVSLRSEAVSDVKHRLAECAPGPGPQRRLAGG
jgi:hypothetical protein